MNRSLNRSVIAAAAILGLMAAGSAGATTCVGTCGTAGADGVVTLPPNGSSSYQWISTNNGTNGVGGLPTGNLGQETNGSTYATSVFTATAGTALNFWFDYVTSDGSTSFTDYAWAALFDSSNALQAMLFTARTNPSGSIVPGFDMPVVNATLNPASVPIIPGGPVWSPLGGSSGTCWSNGCGYTGWVNANFLIADAGDYYLKIGVTNWGDIAYQSGLAMAGVTVGGKPIDTPEPAALGVFGFGALLLGLFAGLRRRCN